MSRTTTTAILLASFLSMPHSVGAQRIDPPFEVNRLTRFDLLKHDSAWQEITLRIAMGATMYEGANVLANHFLPTESKELSNELALLMVLSAAVASEAKAFYHADNTDDIPARFKRIDSAFDAIEMSAEGIQSYVGQQFGLQARLAVSLLMFGLDWHFLPKRDLRR